MWENISWLDVLSFVVSLVTAAIALRLDFSQKRLLESIKNLEEYIARRLDEGGAGKGDTE
jgi:hypothetical protein